MFSNQPNLFESSAPLPRPETDGPSTSATENVGATALVPRPKTDGPGTSSPDTSESASAFPPRSLTVIGPLTSARIFAVDPGQRSGATVLRPPKKAGVNFPKRGGSVSVEDFLAFVKTLREGDIVATESTMHVYRPKDRLEVLLEAEERGVQIWGMRSIFTSRMRTQLFGTNKKGNDEKDARAIYHAFANYGPYSCVCPKGNCNHTKLFYRLRPNPRRMGTINEPDTPRFIANQRFVSARRAGYPGHRNGHIASIAIAAQVAFEFGMSSAQFDVFMGFHATGYPWFLRAQRNKHGAGKKPALRGPKMRLYRRRARQYYSALKKRGGAKRCQSMSTAASSAAQSTSAV